MIKIFTKDFWTTRDILQQVAHFLQGAGYTIIFSALLGNKILWWIGVAIGLLVEVFQYFFVDDRDLRIEDRLRDLFFWFLGGIFTLLLF